MQCSFCKKENPPTATKCKDCGKPLPGSEATFLGEDRVQQAEQPPKQAEAVETFAPNKTSGTPGDWTAPVTGSKIPLTSQGEFEPGTVLGGRYEILALLGQGGMGAVYKARDMELDRLVALKIIRPELTTNPEILRRFKQELILARQVTHRNVIRIFDLGQADGFKFITMEYLDGKDLRAVLQEKGKLSPEEAARIIVQICRALEVAHGEGVVHRDLKPQNIMLDANGRAYVMDFGIARSAHLPGMTQMGALIGTPEYMSPEQAKGEKLDERSDLFSLGVIFYELITGQSPFYSDTPLASLWKRMQEKAKPLCEVDPAIPKPLSDIVAKAMEIEPTDRFASAGEMAQELEFWLNPSAGRTTIIVPAPRTASYWKWASAALVLLLIAAVVAFRLKEPAKPKAEHPPVSVLVADFTNHTGDPIFDGTLEPMFNVALEGASFINAYNRGNARKLAEKLPNPTDKLDEQPARLVAVNQGIGSVIIGELSRRGEKYSLSATALDAATGSVIYKAETTAANKDEVILAIPKLAAPIRRALGDTTPESVQLDAARGPFTASSLEAVHQYGLAIELQFAGKTQEALQSFSKLAEMDPNFARAWAGMASASVNLGRRQDAEKYAKLAMEHVDRMTERERYRIRGLYYAITENTQKCVEEYSALIKQYPADNIGHENLAACYSYLHDMPQALEEARQAVRIAPRDLLARNNLSLYACFAGDFQTCEHEGREVQKLNASDEDGFLLVAHAQLAQEQLSPAAQTYQELEKLSPRGASLASSGLANLALYEGKYREAIQILERGIAADVAAKELDQAADKLAMLADAQLTRGDEPAAIAAAGKALATSQSAKTKFLAARIFIKTGDTAKAQKLAADLGQERPADSQAYAKLILGEIALKGHNAAQAIQLFTEAKNLADTWISHFDLGVAYLEAGSFVEADSEFDTCIKRRGEAVELFNDDQPTYSYLPLVYYYQGRAREGLKSPGSADSYRTYLSIRGQAGEDPLLPDVRKRVAN
jgi:tetratricopeptide (TPR) repeat protein/predicted Ser/Thr protein kinase